MTGSCIDEAEALRSAGQPEAALAFLQARARAGDPAALHEMARWHMVGDLVPRNLLAAREFLELAASQGDEDAELSLIALMANGSGAAPDWSGALKRLRLAADRGNEEAGKHIALLNRMDLLADGAPRQLPRAELLSEHPPIKRWRALLSPAECAHVATRVLDLLAPSMVADPATGRAMPHPVRKSSAAVIGPTRETLPIQAIQRRIASATETKAVQGEPLAVLHYAPGQEYLAHMDTLPNETNQRITTVLLYLNAGYVGGETQFPANGLRIAGALGDAVAFSNVRPDGTPEPASRHAGLAVRSGVKWLATRWIRQAPLDIWTPRG